MALFMLFGCIPRNRQHTGISFDDVEYSLEVTNNTLGCNILRGSCITIENLHISFALFALCELQQVLFYLMEFTIQMKTARMRVSIIYFKGSQIVTQFPDYDVFLSLVIVLP